VVGMAGGGVLRGGCKEYLDWIAVLRPESGSAPSNCPGNIPRAIYVQDITL
jgi:hypothetical protein